MKQHIQTLEEVLSQLSVIESEWKDDTARKVIAIMDKIPEGAPTHEDIKKILRFDFDNAIILLQLFLDKSKDEFNTLRKELFGGPSGRTRFLRDEDAYVSTLEHLLLKDVISTTISREYTWKDILTERLKSGRGSAIKGQKRGRQVEDFVQNIVEGVFGSSYDARSSFLGKSGESAAKSDFAIPSKDQPRIIIEVKAYGATGSKQTDVIGDIQKIISEKRHDSLLLLFTDGITWNARKNDLNKLVKIQNEGYIYRIYTIKMKDQFKDDLQQMKIESCL